MSKVRDAQDSFARTARKAAAYNGKEQHISLPAVSCGLRYIKFRRRCDILMACCCNNKGGCNGNCGQKHCMMDCSIKPVSGCPCNSDCRWYPIEEKCERKMRICCDENGCCGMFPEDCRNKFWPDFAHPRWLCCKDLYCARAGKCC